VWLREMDKGEVKFMPEGGPECGWVKGSRRNILTIKAERPEILVEYKTSNV
jgi:hypothetical protein